MAGSLNKVILIGNVGKEPEIKGRDDRLFATFSIATSERWKDRETGERKEHTDWHNIVVFEPKLVNLVKERVHKGSKLWIEGAMKTRKWTDQYGNERYTTEVVLARFRGDIQILDKSSGGGRPNPEEENYGRSYAGQSGRGDRRRDEYPPAGSSPSGGLIDEPDDDIPF